MKDNQIIMYQTEDGNTKISVTLDNETLWVTQAQMAELFQRERSVITKHISNIFAEGELDKNSVCAKFALTASDGKVYNTDCFNLDVIISVGYRVKSIRGTQFRIWANSILKEYLIKGFAMNDDLLKNPNSNYFDELLARVRDIRSSEKMLYRKIMDIYALSIDYSPKAESSKMFFATVQNKMHYAASGMTASELIYSRADASKISMGLTNWKGDKIDKNEIFVAKNYLTADELDTMNRIVSMYLDFAELQAKGRKPMYMSDWINKLDGFLKLSEREVLIHFGNVSKELAQAKATEQYDKFIDSTTNELSRIEEHFLESLESVNNLLENAKKN